MSEQLEVHTEPVDDIPVLIAKMERLLRHPPQRPGRTPIISDLLFGLDYADVFIPAALREKYSLKPGSVVQVVDYGGVLALVPAFKDPIAEGAGLLKDADSLV